MMIDDQTTVMKQRIERAMLELVDLNNQGVHLLGEGRLELARTAICHATDRIHQLSDTQAQLESYMAQRYQPPLPLNLVLGVGGHCYVTPLEAVDDEGRGRTMMVDHPRAYGICPVPNLTQSSTASVAATATNNYTNEEGRCASSPHNTGGVALKDATTTSTILASPLVEPTLSTTAAASPLTNNVLVEQQQQQQQQQEQRQALNGTPNKEPRLSRTIMMPPLFSFLRPIFFSAQDFLHVVNPPLTHLSVCLSFNLAVANHKIAMRMMQESISSSSSNSSSPPSSRSPSVDDGLLVPDHDDTDDIVEDDDDSQRQQRILVPLQEAIYLYKLAYRLQMEDAGLVEVSRLHTLGIVNNLGQLFYQAEMYTASKECFQALLEMITIHRVRDQGSLLLRRLNHHATLFFSGGEEEQHQQEEQPTIFHQDGGSESLSLPQQERQLQQLHQLLLLQQLQQQIQHDAPYMELFLDNIFQVLAHPQTSLKAPAA